MNEELRSIVVTNGMMMIHVENQEIIITAYKSEIKIPLEKVDQPPSWINVISDTNSPHQWSLTSDIFDLFNETISIDDLNMESVKDILGHMLTLSIQYIGKIIVEEGVAALIVNSYNNETKYLLSTIGLLEDARIIFAEIKEKDKEN